MLTLETVEYTRSRISLQLKLLAIRQADNKRDFEEAVAAGRWSQVAGLDGVGTGLLMAESLLRDELKELERFAQAVVAAKS